MSKNNFTSGQLPRSQSKSEGMEQRQQRAPYNLLESWIYYTEKELTQNPAKYSTSDLYHAKIV